GNIAQNATTTTESHDIFPGDTTAAS
ncbi:hypothetical protein HLRTI_002468, partial [Halorhabdus tiamatea SARL4B]